MIVKVNRRDFAKISAAATAGLVLGLHAGNDASAEPVLVTLHSLGAFIEVGTDGVVTIHVTKSDMGQGVRTALPMIVAEELDADWKNVRIRQADLDRKYGSQGTGGSGSIRNMWMPLRNAGAAARAMLVSAAAAKWGVDASGISVANGVIAHGDKTLGFGDVAEAAAKLDVPKDVKLKDPAQFRIIGKVANRMDNPDLVVGKSKYGIDVKVPGMLYASVLRASTFGATVKSIDDTAAKKVPGVKHVVKIDSRRTELPWNGVAVVADSTWAAMQGRKALNVEWDLGDGASETSASLREAMLKAAAAPSKRVRNDGDVDAALAGAAKKVEATYEVPYLAHATMEPMNATAHVTADGVEIWAPTQFPGWAGPTTAEALGLKPEQSKVHVTLLGGGFGRRANPDFVLEAAMISKAVGAPVKVQWTREDDMQHDYYRPPSVHKVAGAIDASGSLTGLQYALAAPSIEAYMNAGEPEKAHESETGGLDDLVFQVPNYRLEFGLAPSVVPRGWWRSVESSGNGFVVGSFLDELAQAAGKDPIDFTLALLPKDRKIDRPEPNLKDFAFEANRMRAAVELVREKSGWGKPLPAGRARGFAAYYSFLTYAAEVAEVSVADDGTIQVHRITAAIDCGTAVNPDGVRAQIEGGIVYGLTAALHGEITIDKGAVQQSNFHDYPLMRMTEMPKVDVHIVPSGARPSGVGEPGLPPAAAAVANAIFAATGKRLRKLPFQVSPRA